MASFLRLAGIATVCLSAVVARATPVELDPDLQDYTPVSGVSGNLSSIGSDTLNNLMTGWMEAFRAVYPNVVTSIEGKGSATAPPALIEGTAQLGPMSREMKQDEIDRFEERFGYKPTAVYVAIDALAVYVHKDNPVPMLTLPQVDGIFSTTLRLGGAPVNLWGELGLEGQFADRPISLYGRNSASGTYGFFKEHALGKGDFRSTVKEQAGSSAVVQGVATDLFAIGYSGIGYRTSGVRPLPLALDAEGVAFEPTVENCVSGDYPLARFLLVYVNKAPNQPLDQLTLEFLRFVKSRQGQEVVVRDGYYPLPAVVAMEGLEALSR